MIDLTNRERWMADGACVSIGTAAFYPRRGDSLHEPRNVCLFSCPVLGECTDWVMRTELGLGRERRFGVTAGMSPGARQRFEAEWLKSHPEAKGDAA